MKFPLSVKLTCFICYKISYDFFSYNLLNNIMHILAQFRDNVIQENVGCFERKRHNLIILMSLSLPRFSSQAGIIPVGIAWNSVSFTVPYNSTKRAFSFTRAAAILVC